MMEIHSQFCFSILIFFLHVSFILMSATIWQQMWPPGFLGAYPYNFCQKRKKDLPPQKNSDWTGLNDMLVSDPSLWPYA